MIHIYHGWLGNKESTGKTILPKPVNQETYVETPFYQNICVEANSREFHFHNHYNIYIRNKQQHK